MAVIPPGTAFTTLLLVVNSSGQLRGIERGDVCCLDVREKPGSLMQDDGRGHVFGMLAVPRPL